MAALSLRGGGAAVRAAARLRPGGADEGACEFSFDLRCNCVHIDSGLGEELTRIFDVVGSRDFERDVCEPCGFELVLIVRSLKGAGDATDPEEHAVAYGVRDVTEEDHVGDGEAAAGAEDTKCFREDAVFIGGEIDNAVGDDDVDGTAGKGYGFDLAFEEFDVGDACLTLVFAREVQHFVSHVEAIGFACWNYAPG